MHGVPFERFKMVIYDNASNAELGFDALVAKKMFNKMVTSYSGKVVIGDSENDFNDITQLYDLVDGKDGPFKVILGSYRFEGVEYDDVKSQLPVTDDPVGEKLDGLTVAATALAETLKRIEALTNAVLVIASCK